MSGFTTELWIWYGFAMSMVILRMTARLLHFKSISRLQFEDWFMLWITVLYTILCVFLDIVSGTQSNLMEPDDIPKLTPQSRDARIYGSKIILVVEQCMCAVQWGTKACLLILYWRLTENIVQAMLVKATAAYVATTYVVMEVLYMAVWCRPFHNYWAVPTPNPQCSTALHHLIVNLTFNLTSDFLIMSIPLPLVLRAHLEIKRKIILILPFTLGFFSVICAVLSKHLSFTQPYSGEWVNWYCRESSTIMIVSNMPYTWGLIRRIFHTNSFFGGSRGESRADTNSMERAWSHGLDGTPAELRDARSMQILNGQGSPIIPGLAESLSRTTSRTPSNKNPFKISSWTKSPEPGMERLPSTTNSREGDEAAMRDFGDSHDRWRDFTIKIDNDMNVKIDPASSGSSCATTSDRRVSIAHSLRDTRKGSIRSNNDAVDRLYRLDDGDLMLDIERERKRSFAREPE